MNNDADNACMSEELQYRKPNLQIRNANLL